MLMQPGIGIEAKLLNLGAMGSQQAAEAALGVQAGGEMKAGIEEARKIGAK